MAASSITCLLWRHKISGEHFRVFCFSPLIILGKMEQKPFISYPQIFLKFLLYFMIDVMKKKIVFLNKPFIAFFILQVLENSDFSYLSLHDFFRLFRPIIIERGNLCKFHWDKPCLSGITQQIHIPVQDVSIDEFRIHWEIRLFPGESKLK